MPHRNLPGRPPGAAPDLPPAGDEPVLRPKVVPPPASGVVVFESRHAPGFAPSVLEQDFAKFLLVIAGQARLSLGTAAHLLAADSLVHVTAHTRHFYADVPADPVTLYAIHYQPAILPVALATGLAGLPVQHWRLGSSSIDRARTFRSDFREMLFEQTVRREGWEAVLLARLLNLAVNALRLRDRYALEPPFTSTKGRDSAERVASYAARLESEFIRQKTLDDAALTTGLSRRQFTGLFRKLTGTTWHRYLERLRLEHARKLLEQTDRSILAVAFESGFENLSNFHRGFRRAFHCSPSQCRQSLGEPSAPDQAPPSPSAARPSGKADVRSPARGRKRCG